jgi:hypothetical protein
MNFPALRLLQEIWRRCMPSHPIARNHTGIRPRTIRFVSGSSSVLGTIKWYLIAPGKRLKLQRSLTYGRNCSNLLNFWRFHTVRVSGHSRVIACSPLTTGIVIGCDKCIRYYTYEVSTAVKLSMLVFWVVNFPLKVEAVCSSETLALTVSKPRKTTFTSECILFKNLCSIIFSSYLIFLN